MAKPECLSGVPNTTGTTTTTTNPVSPNTVVLTCKRMYPIEWIYAGPVSDLSSTNNEIQSIEEALWTRLKEKQAKNAVEQERMHQFMANNDGDAASSCNEQQQKDSLSSPVLNEDNLVRLFTHGLAMIKRMHNLLTSDQQSLNSASRAALADATKHMEYVFDKVMQLTFAAREADTILVLPDEDTAWNLWFASAKADDELNKTVFALDALQSVMHGGPSTQNMTPGISITAETALADSAALSPILTIEDVSTKTPCAGTTMPNGKKKLPLTASASGTAVNVGPKDNEPVGCNFAAETETNKASSPITVRKILTSKSLTAAAQQQNNQQQLPPTHVSSSAAVYASNPSQATVENSNMQQQQSKSAPALHADACDKPALTTIQKPPVAPSVVVRQAFVSQSKQQKLQQQQLIAPPSFSIFKDESVVSQQQPAGQQSQKSDGAVLAVVDAANYQKPPITAQQHKQHATTIQQPASFSIFKDESCQNPPPDRVTPEIVASPSQVALTSQQQQQQQSMQAKRVVETVQHTVITTHTKTNVIDKENLPVSLTVKSSATTISKQNIVSNPKTPSSSSAPSVVVTQPTTEKRYHTFQNRRISIQPCSLNDETLNNSGGNSSATDLVDANHQQPSKQPQQMFTAAASSTDANEIFFQQEKENFVGRAAQRLSRGMPPALVQHQPHQQQQPQQAVHFNMPAPVSNLPTTTRQVLAKQQHHQQQMAPPSFSIFKDPSCQDTVMQAPPPSLPVVVIPVEDEIIAPPSCVENTARDTDAAQFLENEQPPISPSTLVTASSTASSTAEFEPVELPTASAPSTAHRSINTRRRTPYPLPLAPAKIIVADDDDENGEEKCEDADVVVENNPDCMQIEEPHAADAALVDDALTLATPIPPRPSSRGRIGTPFARAAVEPSLADDESPVPAAAGAVCAVITPSVTTLPALFKIPPPPPPLPPPASQRPAEHFRPPPMPPSSSSYGRRSSTNNALDMSLMPGQRRISTTIMDYSMFRHNLETAAVASTPMLSGADAICGHLDLDEQTFYDDEDGVQPRQAAAVISEVPTEEEEQVARTTNVGGFSKAAAANASTAPPGAAAPQKQQASLRAQSRRVSYLGPTMPVAAALPVAPPRLLIQSSPQHTRAVTTPSRGDFAAGGDAGEDNFYRLSPIKEASREQTTTSSSSSSTHMTGGNVGRHSTSRFIRTFHTTLPSNASNGVPTGEGGGDACSGSKNDDEEELEKIDPYDDGDQITAVAGRLAWQAHVMPEISKQEYIAVEQQPMPAVRQQQPTIPSAPSENLLIDLGTSPPGVGVGAGVAVGGIDYEALEMQLRLKINGQSYFLDRKITSAKHSCIYRLMDLVGGEEAESEAGFVVKLITYEQLLWWEFYINLELIKRLSAGVDQQTVAPAALGHFIMLKSVHVLTKKASEQPGASDLPRIVGLSMPYSPDGTLADILMSFKKRVTPEELALKYAIDVLRAVSTLRSIDIIHADVAPDNFMCCNREAVTALLKSNKNDDADEQPIAEQLIKLPILQLIDFSNSIDLRVLGSGGSAAAVKADNFNKVFENYFTYDVMLTERQTPSWMADELDLLGLLSTLHKICFAGHMSDDDLTDKQHDDDDDNGAAATAEPHTKIKWRLPKVEQAIEQQKLDPVWGELFNALLQALLLSRGQNGLSTTFDMAYWLERLERVALAKMQASGVEKVANVFGSVGVDLMCNRKSLAIMLRKGGNDTTLL